MRHATIRWGRGKTHLYLWDSITTACGREAPEDWAQVDGGVTYEAVTHYPSKVTCASCSIAATAEVLDRCVTY